MDRLTAEQVQAADAEARAHFTYTPDAPGANPWRDFAAQAEAGSPWSGECADLATTTLRVLKDQGQPITALYRCAVDATGCGHADHCIGATQDHDGLWWIVGDTFRPAYAARDCLHTPVQFQRMDDVTVWSLGAPWA